MLDIPSLDLGAKVLEAHCKTMRKGNTLLKQCAEMTGMEHRVFRSKIFRGFNPAECGKDGKPVWPNLDHQTIAFIQQARPFIMAVKSIEWSMLRAFSPLVRRHARSWGTSGGAIYGMDDFLQEGYMALTDAIYAYTCEETKFITFAWWCIYRRMATAANQTNPFGPLTNAAIELLKRFDAAAASINGPVKDEDIYKVAKFTPDEIETLKDVKVRVCNETEVVAYTYNDGESVNDYTAARRGINTEEDTIPLYEMREALASADLTPFERKVVETSLSPHYGWQSELAASEINPKTKQPYTRAAIGVILERALKKIKDAYMKVA
jgi:DNA-directed RNA polymerase specialized sigma subunit